MRVRRWVECVCWTSALVCAAALLRLHEGVLAADRAAAAVAAVPPAAMAPASGQVFGELSVPSLGLTVPVVEGDDHGDLLHGVGHITGTAMPGGLGTVALAGHRDTFLRPLEHIRPHMRIDLSDGDATYHYIVDSTEIVWPEDVRVLDTTTTPELILVTCYPFHYVGAAPRRFIVHARLLSLVPDRESPHT